MTSAVLSSLHKTSVSVISAVAMHRKPDDFCRELALRSLNAEDVVAVCIASPTHNAEIQVIGRYGNAETLSLIYECSDEIEIAIRERNRASLRNVEVQSAQNKRLTVALIPSGPLAVSTAVIMIFFKENKVAEILDEDAQIALAFACEMYCSPSWGNPPHAAGKNHAKLNGLGADGALTSRQRHVLELMSEGRTNERIARMLNYSVATVKNDISAIFQFLGVSNRHDAIDEGVNRGLLTVASGTE